MPIDTGRIRAFLSTVEGPQQLRGYIPCDYVVGGVPCGTANYTGGANPERHVPMGVSGVTIGTGVDLGQTSADELSALGVNAGIVNCLYPYLGRRGPRAVTALHLLPLSVSRDAADELDAAMHAYHIDLARLRYDGNAGDGAFERLPWQAQAAIVSILYQRGAQSPRKYPNTWAAFVRQDWQDAANRLCNGTLWSGYQSRRRAEGNLLKELI